MTPLWATGSSWCGVYRETLWNSWWDTDADGACTFGGVAFAGNQMDPGASQTLEPGASQTFDLSGAVTLSVQEALVPQLEADFNAGPVAWALGGRYPGPAVWSFAGGGDTGAGAETGETGISGFGDVAWVSAPVPGVLVTRTGGLAVPTSPADAAAGVDPAKAGAVVATILGGYTDQTLDRCPALPAGGDGTIAPVVQGVPGVNPMLTFEPVVVPQDLPENAIVCAWLTDAFDGVRLEVGRADPETVDVAELADMNVRVFNTPATISEPVDLLGGTLVVVDSNSGGTLTVWAYWTDENVRVVGALQPVVREPSQQERFDVTARWMVLNLPTILSNVAAYSPR